MAIDRRVRAQRAQQAPGQQARAAKTGPPGPMAIVRRALPAPVPRVEQAHAPLGRAQALIGEARRHAAATARHAPRDRAARAGQHAAQPRAAALVRSPPGVGPVVHASAADS